MIEPCLDHGVIHRATVSLFVSVAYDLRHVVAHQVFIVSWLQRIKILDTSGNPRTGEALRLQVSKLDDLASWNRCCRCVVFVCSLLAERRKKPVLRAAVGNGAVPVRCVQMLAPASSLANVKCM